VIAELYRFTLAGTSYFFADAQSPIVYQNQEYRPEYIRRDAIKGTSEIARSGQKIRLARDNEFAALFVGPPPTRVAEVDIFRQEDGTTALIYSGRVLTVTRRGSEAVADCQSIFASLRQTGVRRHYQRQCTHTLYEPNSCRVNRSEFQVQATLSAIDGVSVSADAFDTKPDGWFTGGELKWGQAPELRSIVAHNGDTITIGAPIPDAEAGDTVSAFAGCDHLFTTCRDKFDNEENYGGFLAIPRRNPFGSDPVF